MEDIAPKLLEYVQNDFNRLCKENRRIQVLDAKIQSGNGSYIDAHYYAQEVGRCMAKVFHDYVSAEVLPDGKMYYNIADRVVRPMLELLGKLVDERAMMVQETLNRKAGIGLKARSGLDG